MNQTRHISAVYLNGCIAHAQFGRFDGYPAHAGLIVRHFVEHIANRPQRIDYFTERLGAARFLTDKLWNALWLAHAGVDISTQDFTLDQPTIDAFYQKFPCLETKFGAEWLRYVYDQSADVRSVTLKSTPEFACDGLNCAWAYVVNLDTKTLEVYVGGRTTPGNYGVFEPYVAAHFDLEQSTNPATGQTYYPCQLVRVYPFDNLGSDDEFVAECEAAKAAGEDAGAPVVVNGTALEVVPTAGRGTLRYGIVGGSDPHVILMVGNPEDPDCAVASMTFAATQAWARALADRLDEIAMEAP